MNINPLLTVVMPTYNGEKYIKEAIDSVLNQSFGNFELLIINDGSVDSSLDIINSYDDDRIRIIDLKQNMGIAHCRNLGLREARGEFLTWTDSDDVNLPERFEKQLTFLLENEDYGACGTWLARFNNEKIIYITKAYKNSEKIKAALLFKPASIPNATAMLRLSAIRNINVWYNEDLKISEDYDFIFSCSRFLKLTNLQEVLYLYRVSETSIMKRFEEQEKDTFNIVKLVYKKVLATLEIFPTEQQLRIHYSICSSKIFTEFEEFENCYYWLETLKISNDKLGTYDRRSFNHIITEQFFFLSKKASVFGLRTLFFFISKSAKNNWKMNFRNYLKLAVRCALKYDKFEFKLS